MTPTRRSLLAAGAALPFLGALPARAQRQSGVLRFGLSSFPPSIQPWVNTGTAAATVKLLTREQRDRRARCREVDHATLTGST